MTNVDNEQLSSDLSATIHRLENSSKWVSCLWCGEEVNRLRPMVYYRGGKSYLLEACIGCAESPKGLYGASSAFPCDGIEFKEHPQGVVVAYGQMEYLVTKSVNRLSVQKPGGDVKVYDNAIQAWLAISSEAERGEPVREERAWGKRKTDKATEGIWGLLLSLLWYRFAA